MLAFRHPVPGFQPIHLLLVPKLSARSVLALSRTQREQIAAEVEQLAPACLENLGHADSGFLVVVNGGARQDVRQVHFHLLTAGYDLAPAPSGLAAGAWIEVPDPALDLHQVRIGEGAMAAGLAHVRGAAETLQLQRRGYSIIWDGRSRGSDLVVHLTAGMPAPSA